MATATEPEQRQLSERKTSKLPATVFRENTTKIAGTLLTDWVGDARAREATGRIATALSASAASAKKPEEFYACTLQSIAKCVAIAALTGIMPSTGATALAYVIPRRPRKGEDPQLQYQFSHRGLNALARRCGQMMIPIPLSYEDEISVSEDGGVMFDDVDFDNPPTSYEDLRGVVIVVKNTDQGITLCRCWVPKKIIDQRRDASDSYQYAVKNDWAKDSDPWHQWPVEMAMKAAMHYAIGRGWCVIDDTEAVRALSSESSEQFPRLPAAAPVAPELRSPESLTQSRQVSQGEPSAEIGDVAADEIRSVNMAAYKAEILATTKVLEADGANAVYERYFNPDSVIPWTDEDVTLGGTIRDEHVATIKAGRKSSGKQQQGTQLYG